MELQIKKRDYTTTGSGTDERAIMHMIARDDQGERYHLTNDEVRSYFYVPTDEVDSRLRNSEHVHHLEDGFSSVRDKDLTRVYTYIPGDVPQIREDYSHYEADILFPNRFSLDTDIYSGIDVDQDISPGKHEVALSDIEKIENTVETRVLHCDIEVDDSNGFPQETEASEEIVCLTFYDTFTQEYTCYLYYEDELQGDIEPSFVSDFTIEVFDSEVEMLEEFSNYIQENPPDVMTGWNFSEFDALYLVNRFDELDGLSKSDLSPLGSAYQDSYYGKTVGKIKGICIFDMLSAYKNLQFTELDSYSLGDVAEAELDVGKLNSEDKKIAEMWNNDVTELLEYNIRDVYLTVELERQNDIIRFYEEVADIVGGRLSEVQDYSKAAEMYVLRTVNDMFVVPSAREIEGGDEEFEGAEVFDPSTGIMDFVSVLDLKSLYPMSMKTLNAGPTTKDPDGDITAPNGVSFTTEKDSVVKELIDNLLDNREDLKEERDQYPSGSKKYVKYDLQQQGVKIIMNTLYGLLGWDRFRLYDEDVAAAVTATGREVIKYSQEKVEELGYEVVYGDTDSVMIKFDDYDRLPGVINEGKRIERYINESYNEFAKEVLDVDEHFFEMEFEKVYRRFMQAGKKKRYAGSIVYKDGKQVHQTDIVGLEYQRSDYCSTAKELQKSLIELILAGASKEEVSDLVTNSIERIKNLDYEWDSLGIPGGIGRPFDEYDNKTKHVRAAEYANENLGEQIQPGDKPKGIYVSSVGSDYPSPPTVSSSQFICWLNSNNIPETTRVDFNKFLSNQIYGPLSRIIECTQWQWGEIKNGEDQAGLSEFDSSESNTSDMFGEVKVEKQEKEQSQETKETTDEVSLDDFESREQVEVVDVSNEDQERDDEQSDKEGEDTSPTLDNFM